MDVTATDPADNQRRLAEQLESELWHDHDETPRTPRMLTDEEKAAITARTGLSFDFSEVPW